MTSPTNKVICILAKPMTVSHDKLGITVEKDGQGTSLVIQWLRLCTPNAGGPGSIPAQGTRSSMPQLRARMRQQRSRVLQVRPGSAK